MNCSKPNRGILAIILAVVLTIATGCDWRAFYTSTASAAAGFLAASRMTQTTAEHRCFVDGVEVDCSQLSSPSQQ